MVKIQKSDFIDNLFYVKKMKLWLIPLICLITSNHQIKN